MNITCVYCFCDFYQEEVIFKSFVLLIIISYCGDRRKGIKMIRATFLQNIML